MPTQVALFLGSTLTYLMCAMWVVITYSQSSLEPGVDVILLPLFTFLGSLVFAGILALITQVIEKGARNIVFLISYFFSIPVGIYALFQFL